jgi:membrane protein implicated in regulation of membrane protease activity
MKIFDRFKVVVVLYAVTGLIFALSDAVFPQLGLYKFWFNSRIFAISLFVIYWLIAPYVYRKFNARKTNQRSPDKRSASG